MLPLPARRQGLPAPHPVAIRPSPRPQAASAGWEGGAPGADKIWKREVCVELGAVCSLEQVNVPTSCPSRPWESTSKQPDLQKEGQAWPEVGGLGEEREGRKRGARLSPLPPGSLLTTPHVESPEITPGICISMRFRSRIRNRRRVWGIFRRSFPLPLPAKGCLRALAEAVDTGGGQEGGGRCCQLCEVPGVASGWTTLQMETPRQEKGFFCRMFPLSSPLCLFNYESCPCGLQGAQGTHCRIS